MTTYEETIDNVASRLVKANLVGTKSNGILYVKELFNNLLNEDLLVVLSHRKVLHSQSTVNDLNHKTYVRLKTHWERMDLDDK